MSLTQTTAELPLTTALTQHRATDILMNLVVALLAPMFLGATEGDISLARLAAIETVNDYRTRNQADLLTVAQIIAFGLAALGSLSLSMADDISLPMALRLRGNANACNRSAEQNRRALTETPHANPISWHPEPEAQIHQDGDQPEPGRLLSQAAADMLAAEHQARLRDPALTADQRPIPSIASTSAPNTHRAIWATAMSQEAEKIDASMPTLPQAQRQAASMRAAMLNSTAHQLLNGQTP